jgi:hypothetical protein
MMDLDVVRGRLRINATNGRWLPNAIAIAIVIAARHCRLPIAEW